jgi:hypothetical protein
VSKYHGGKGLVYLSTTGTGAAASVGSLTSWSLDRATDSVEVTCFGDVNKTYVQGLPDVKGSISGYFDDTGIDGLFTSAASTDGVKLYLYPSSSAVTKYFYGPAWLSVSVDCSSDAAVKVSGDFVANGAWGNK